MRITLTPEAIGTLRHVVPRIVLVSLTVGTRRRTRVRRAAQEGIRFRTRVSVAQASDIIVGKCTVKLRVVQVSRIGYAPRVLAKLVIAVRRWAQYCSINLDDLHLNECDGEL